MNVMSGYHQMATIHVNNRICVLNGGHVVLYDHDIDVVVVDVGG